MKEFFQCLEQHALCSPRKLALTGPVLSGQVVSLNYRELTGHIEQIAIVLQEQHCQRIGLLLDNSIDWVFCDLAALSVGITIIPIPLFFSYEQRAYLVKDAALDSLIVATKNHESTQLPPEIKTYFHGEEQSPVPQAIAGEFVQSALPGLSACLLRRSNAASLLPKRWPNQVAKLTYQFGESGTPRMTRLSASSLYEVIRKLSELISPADLQRYQCILPMASLLETIISLYVPLYMEQTVQLESMHDLGITLSPKVHSKRVCATNLLPQSMYNPAVSMDLDG